MRKARFGRSLALTTNDDGDGAGATVAWPVTVQRVRFGPTATAPPATSAKAAPQPSGAANDAKAVIGSTDAASDDDGGAPIGLFAAADVARGDTLFVDRPLSAQRTGSHAVRTALVACDQCARCLAPPTTTPPPSTTTTPTTASATAAAATPTPFAAVVDTQVLALHTALGAAVDAAPAAAVDGAVAPKPLPLTDAVRATIRAAVAAGASTDDSSGDGSGAVACLRAACGAVYCSAQCRDAAWAEHHQLLCCNAITSTNGSTSSAAAAQEVQLRAAAHARIVTEDESLEGVFALLNCTRLVARVILHYRHTQRQPPPPLSPSVSAASSSVAAVPAAVAWSAQQSFDAVLGHFAHGPLPMTCVPNAEQIVADWRVLFAHEAVTASAAVAVRAAGTAKAVVEATKCDPSLDALLCVETLTRIASVLWTNSLELMAFSPLAFALDRLQQLQPQLRTSTAPSDTASSSTGVGDVKASGGDARAIGEAVAVLMSLRARARAAELSYGRASFPCSTVSALFPVYSTMNHACAGSSICLSAIDTSLDDCERAYSPHHRHVRRITVRAAASIARGTEVLTSYVAPELPISEKRERLRMRWEMNCCCAQCMAAPKL